MERRANSNNFQVYEKNPSVGGTWFENRYPGCACDVPSHNYVYSFEPKADFSSVYSNSEEIQGYFEGFVHKYGLEKYLRLSHAVVGATWMKERGQWKVEIKNLLTDEVINDWCHILIHASGYLNKPAWPELPGLDDFRGLMVHSADYDPNISLKDRNVLLVGAGSSAVQILPTIQPLVRSITIFIRSPIWVLPDISAEATNFTQEEIENFVNNPQTVLELRQNNERTMNSIFSMLLINKLSAVTYTNETYRRLS